MFAGLLRVPVPALLGTLSYVTCLLEPQRSLADDGLKALAFEVSAELQRSQTFEADNVDDELTEYLLTVPPYLKLFLTLD